MNILLFNKRYTSTHYNQYKVQIDDYSGPYYNNIKEAIENGVKCYTHYIKHKAKHNFIRWIEDNNTKIILQFNINNSDLDKNDLLIKFAEVIPEELL